MDKCQAYQKNAGSIVVLLISLTLLGLSACASSGAHHESSHPASQPSHLADSSTSPYAGANAQELEAFHEIERLFHEQAYEKTESKIVFFRRRFRTSSLQANVANLKGLILLQKAKPQLATSEFEEALSLTPDSHPLKSYYLYNLASAQYAANEFDSALRTLGNVDSAQLNRESRLKVYFLKANLYEKKQLLLETARQLLSAGRYLEDLESSASRSSVGHYLESSLAKITDISALEDLAQETSDSPFSDSVLYRLTRLEIAAGKTKQAEDHLRRLIQRYPQSTYLARAKGDLDQLLQTSVVDHRAIGILLPVSGKFGKFGNKALQAIELAFGLYPQITDAPFQQNTKERGAHGSSRSGNSSEIPVSSSSGIKLIIEDSGEEPEDAVRALNRLVAKYHVVAVIGPLLSKGIDQITERAQQLGVPLLSLASRSTSSSQDFIFQAGVTQSLQAYEMARYAVEKLGLKKFAVVFPNDKMGREVIDDFWTAVESFGGQMMGAESYNPGDTDFRHPVDKLSGLYYKAARTRELQALEKEREANKIHKRTRRTEQFYALKPIVDYEAVFIPDDARIAGQIIPTFAYRDIENIQFLGISAWNSPEFLKRTQNYSQNASFVEPFFTDSTSPQIRKFLMDFRLAFQEEPTSLEAVAHDAGQILFRIMKKNESLDRVEIKEALTSLRDFPGVTGKISYRNGQLYRELKLISVKSNRFYEVN